MNEETSILAVVPARSGSKGIPDKNLQQINGLSLIALAARCLHAVPAVNRRLLSTDSPRYAEEGVRHGLECPFLRPHELSTDQAGAIETMQHAWIAAEAHFAERYDVLLIVEPTSPLRRPSDIEACLQLLSDPTVDSVVTVSRVDTKFHPAKLLKIEGQSLRFHMPEGATVKSRQSLSSFYYRNGACYAIRRRLLLEEGKIFGDHTLPHVIDRPLVNIDEPFDLELARWLWQKEFL